MYQCPVPGCGKKYRRRCRAVEHVKLRHNPGGIVRYACGEDNCSRSYCRQDALRTHQRTEKHHGFQMLYEPNGSLAAFDSPEPEKKPKAEGPPDEPAEASPEQKDEWEAASSEPVESSTSVPSQETPESQKSEPSPSPPPAVCELQPPAAVEEEHIEPLEPVLPPSKVLPPLRPYKDVFRVTESDALRFRCTVPDCGKSYASRYRLSIHMVDTHAVKSERPFLCPIQTCQRAYATKESLKRHKRATGHFEESEPKDNPKVEVEKPPEKKTEPGTTPNLEERVQQLVDLFDEIK